MERGISIAVQAANLVHELSAELSNPVRATELVWRFRTAYEPQLAALWQHASLIPGISDRQYLPASVEAIKMQGLDSDSKQVYTMTQLTEANASDLVRDIIDKLRWLAQCSLGMRG
jgi:hypothetical protein